MNNWSISFQQPATNFMKELIQFHNFLLIITGSIVIIICIVLTYVCIKYNAKIHPIPIQYSNNISIEIIFNTIIIILLIIISIPSLKILNLSTQKPKSDITIKVIGYQWYWHYIYPEHNINYDSYIANNINSNIDYKRLLDVNNRLIVPENSSIKFLVTSKDVIHSFSIPALGIKIDAIPGKLNEIWTQINTKGIYYGQCSELCGINHGFMPISIEVISKDQFNKWLNQTKVH